MVNLSTNNPIKKIMSTILIIISMVTILIIIPMDTILIIIRMILLRSPSEVDSLDSELIARTLASIDNDEEEVFIIIIISLFAIIIMFIIIS